MAIPISYNFRNLVVRRTTSVMTALGISLTVAVLVAVLALVEGLRVSLTTTAHPLNVLVLRKGATSELVSGMSRTTFQDLKLRRGIARNAAGEPMASLEMVTTVNLANQENPDGMNLNVRGLLPIGLEMRGGRIIAGRAFETGKRELVVGKSIASRYPDARLSGVIHFARGDWNVVGVLDAGQSAVNSEILADLNQVSADFNRSEGLSSAILRTTDPAAQQTLIQEIESDPKLNNKAITESSYYESQTNSAAPIRIVGIAVAIIMAIGSSFAAMNTMYAAVARRSAEIGTLRVLGFSRGGILFSFFLESLLLSLAGGAIGCLLTLPLNNVTTAVGNFVSFSEIAFNFHVGPKIMLTGVVFALVMGAVGGLFPARMAAKKEILAAFREV